MEPKDELKQYPEQYIIVLHDEEGKRLLPIWVGSYEGESIAI